MSQISSGLSRSDDEHGKFQVVPDGVDRVAENEVFQPSVAVRPHDYEVRVNLTGVAHDLALRRGRVGDRRFAGNPLLPNRFRYPVEVLLPQLDLRRRRLLAVKLAGDPFL